MTYGNLCDPATKGVVRPATLAEWVDAQLRSVDARKLLVGDYLLVDSPGVRCIHIADPDRGQDFPSIWSFFGMSGYSGFTFGDAPLLHWDGSAFVDHRDEPFLEAAL